MAVGNRQKMILNAMISVADPEIRGLAEKLARTVPQASFWRSSYAERILGVAKAIVESSAEGMHPAIGALVEKFTDLLDFSGSSLFSRDAPPASVKERAESFLKEAERVLKRQRKRRRSKKKMKRLASSLTKAIVGTPQGQEALRRRADNFWAEQLKKWKGR